MKKMLLMAGVLALAACGEKKAEAPAADATGEMAPTTMPADTAMMSHDTDMMHSDSMMARDSVK